jgi:hypothetical protein
MLDLVMHRYPDRLVEDISIFFHELIHFLLLCGEISLGDPGCGYDLSLTLRENHEEDKFIILRDYLSAFLARDQGNITRWDILEYHVQFPVQSNNNTMRPRIICNMKFP